MKAGRLGLCFGADTFRASGVHIWDYAHTKTVHAVATRSHGTGEGRKAQKHKITRLKRRSDVHAHKNREAALESPSNSESMRGVMAGTAMPVANNVIKVPAKTRARSRIVGSLDLFVSK